ncbi:MAG TPA: NADH-quinone oxidoreductase subunit L [Gaiellaceae bacterium]|nr:NADH-quinone oxidoreductase subunit L [Gaiellaceae bacterium]
MTQGAWLCLLAPFAGAFAITVMGDTIGRRTAGWISTLSVFAAFGGAVAAFVGLLRHDAEDRQFLSTSWTWLNTGSFDVGLSLIIDPLSATMMLIVTGVGGLIVLYSVGYMDGDDEERRYFAYMALFVFAMLMLVQAGNLLLLLVGWGLVGLASYLLIGFWHERPEAVAAAKKAFVMNAFGDSVMALAFFVLVWETGSLDFADAFGATEAMSSTAVNLVALGLLGGAIAKSAQLPLHTWLPDAMEGPTPVSALIHAATMVTAGVYLICRAHPIFEAAPSIQDLAAGIGAVTLVVAGLVALVQTDIKRVIAYSTMSQIGYMFVGAGVGAYGFAMFHLMTHAFFKALLFMAAGVVIHHLGGEQDIRRMGGLRRLMPFTFAAFLIGSLALVGIPPLSGFFSKDGIIASTLDAGTFGLFLFAAGLVGTLLTGLYTFRLFFVVWGGEPSALVREHAGGEHAGDAHGRQSEDDASREHGEPHHGEGPWTMLVPVGILSVLAVVGGWIQIPGVWHEFTHWIEPVAHPLVEPSLAQELLTSSLAVGLGLVGMAIAWLFYGTRRRDVPSAAGVRHVLEHKFYFDELYDAAFYRPAVAVSGLWRRWIEEPLIGGSITGVSVGAQRAGGAVGDAQTGYLRSYALAIAAAVAVLTVVFLTVR